MTSHLPILSLFPNFKVGLAVPERIILFQVFAPLSVFVLGISFPPFLVYLNLFLLQNISPV